jgi:Zn-dependent protease with chaperone function
VSGNHPTQTHADTRIRVTCPGCERSYHMPRDAAGKRGTCKKCGTAFSIPLATRVVEPARQEPAQQEPAQKDPAQPQTAQTQSPSKSAVDAAQLLQLLGDSVVFPKQPIRAAHRVVALLVAATMLILPIIYLGFIVGVGWLTWWHIRYDWIWMKVAFGHAALFAGAMYIGLGLGGILWTISLIRPLFMGVGGADQAGGLSRADEPMLYAFAERLADKVGCPRPQIIRLSLDVNASAYYETSLFGLRRRAFTLTLGLPLVRGMTLCQLAGVMAHEFGHFGQRGSGFLNNFIWRVNRWFAVAVSRRDMVDDLIETLGSGGHYLATLVALVLKVLVDLGRYFLLALMYVGVFVSASLMRRMEFDADGYEMGVIGSAEFAASCQRVLALALAHETAFKYAFQTLQNRILPSDLVAYTAELADRSPRLKKRAKKQLETEKHSWLASHPPLRARIAAAKKLNLPGVLISPLPGTALFKSFENRCVLLTAALYEHRYGRILTPDAIRPVNEAVDIYLDMTAANRHRLMTGAD